MIADAETPERVEALEALESQEWGWSGGWSWRGTAGSDGGRSCGSAGALAVEALEAGAGQRQQRYGNVITAG